MDSGLALGGQKHSLSLDAIQDSNEAVYLHVLDDIPSYLEVIASDAVTVVAPDKFGNFVADIHTASPEHLDDVIARSSEACQVDLLTDVSADVWPHLAKYDRFPVTFKNVDAYIDEFGVDSMLAAALMATAEIAIEEDDSDASKLKIALVLLGSKSVISSAEHRVNLVHSLQLDAHIPPSSVPKEAGELVGWLIANSELKDGADAFTALVPNDLDGLAFAISKSKDFVTYMTTTEVKPVDVGKLVNHSLVPTTVKDAIIDRIAEFTVGTSATSLRLVGSYAARVGKQIPFSEVQRFAVDGVDSPLVVRLLQPHLALYGVAEISSVLDTLGGSYAELTKRSGKHPKFIKDDAHQALAERLRELGIVSSITDRDDRLVVNMLRS